MPMSRIEKKAKLPIASQRGNECRSGACSAAVVAAVVFMVIVPGVVLAVPFAATDDGLNEQEAPDGRLEQAKEIVPLNPAELTTEKGTVPPSPGAATTAVAFEAMDA